METNSRCARLKRAEAEARRKSVDVYKLTSEVDRQINLMQEVIGG
jgi:hypothetical protein